ncbi:MAG TPA: phage holin family protein [Acidothermales bacterium]
MTTNDTGQPASDASTAELVSRLGEQVSTLIRSELRLAQVELQEKGKRAGIGVGLFGGAGLVALFGAGALVACAILALALIMDAWLAALIVGVVLLAVAGILALVGRSQVRRAAPPLPTEAVEGIKQDIQTVKERRH